MRLTNYPIELDARAREGDAHVVISGAVPAVAPVIESVVIGVTTGAVW